MPIATLNGRWQICDGICKTWAKDQMAKLDKKCDVKALKYWNWQKMALSLFSSSLENTSRQNMEDKATKNAENMTAAKAAHAMDRVEKKIERKEK